MCQLIYIIVLELYCFEKRHVIALIQQIKVGPATLVVSVMEAQRGDHDDIATPPFMQARHMQVHNKLPSYPITQ